MMNIRHIAVYLLVVAGFTCLSVDRVLAQRRGSLPTPEKTTIPEEGVEVEMLRFNTLPMIEAKINDKGPFRLIVDTGAAGVVLNESLAKELELPSPPGIVD